MRRRTCKKFLGAMAAVMFLAPTTTFAADSLASAFSEGIFSGSLRLYSWTRDFDGFPSEDDGKSTPFGGFVSFETAPLTGFSAGLGFKWAQEVVDDKDYGEYFGLMPEENESWAGISEYYLRYNGFDTQVTVGAQYIDTPYMNPADFRLVPYSFRGISLINNSLRNFEFNAGYFTDWMGWTDDEYHGMTTSLEAPFGMDAPSSDEGNWYGGVSWQPIRGMDANIWYYNFTDAYSIITPQFKWFKMFGPDWKGMIDIRTAKWDGIGDEVIGDVDTYMVGFIGLIGWKDLSLVLYGQQNGDQDLQETYGHRRAVTQQVNRAFRAEETAFAAKLEYDFSNLGLKGLSAYARYGIYDTPDPGEENFTQDYTELEFQVKYNFKGPWQIGRFLKGTGIRVRYAYVDKDEDQPEDYPPFLQKLNADINDLRIYLDYEF